jgi:hypothetical protein
MTEKQLSELLAAKGFRLWDRYKEWGATSGPRYSVGLCHVPNEGWVMAMPCNTLADVERVARSQTMGEALKLKYRCPFTDHNGLQCSATSEQPYTDGWTNGSWGDVYPEGFYCPKHADALDKVEEEGGFDEQ